MLFTLDSSKRLAIVRRMLLNSISSKSTSGLSVVRDEGVDWIDGDDVVVVVVVSGELSATTCCGVKLCLSMYAFTSI